MILDQATEPQMQAAQIFGGATMVAFLGARFFRRQAQKIRLMTAAIYIAGVLGFIVYVLI